GRRVVALGDEGGAVGGGEVERDRQAAARGQRHDERGGGPARRVALDHRDVADRQRRGAVVVEDQDGAGAGGDDGRAGGQRVGEVDREALVVLDRAVADDGDRRRRGRQVAGQDGDGAGGGGVVAGGGGGVVAGRGAVHGGEVHRGVDRRREVDEH